MNINIDILKNDERYRKVDQIIDILFCISSAIFAFAIPFQFTFTPWIAHWFFAVIIFKFYYVLRNKENLISLNFKDSIAIISLGGFGLWALLSTFWSLNPEHTHKLAINWLSSLLIIPGIYIFSSKRLPITLMMKAYVCGCTALIIYTLTDLTETALNGNIRFYICARLEIMRHIESVSYHHIYLGFIIAVSLFISAKFLFNSKTSLWGKIYYTTHSILALYLLAIDNSRIVTLALFISALLFFVCQINKNKKLGLLVLAVFIILIITFIVFPTRLGETVIKFAENGDADDPRFHIWKAVLSGLKDVPFLGYGYSAVDDIYAKLFQKSECWFALNSHYSTHNQFMEAFFTLGYIGLAFIVMFLAGIVILLKKNRSILLASMLILLLVSMIFEIPFCHCFAIPLLIAWFIFCYSDKTDMEIEMPKHSFAIPAIVTIVFTGIIAVNSYKSVNKYSSKGQIETTDYSQRKFTKKALKKNKITDENIDMIIYKGESGSVYTLKDLALDMRDYAFTNTTDTLVFSTDYFISEDFSAEKILMIAQHNYSYKKVSEKALDLTKRNSWASDTLIINPTYTKIVNCKTNQIEIRHTKATTNRVLIQTELHNAKTFSDLRGYALFKNMKIEPLHKHHNKQ